MYDVENNKHISKQLPLKVPFFSRSIIVPFLEKLLICGGRETSDSKGLQIVKMFNLKDLNSYEVLPEMSNGRCNHALVIVKRLLYVIGGCDHNNSYTNKCEVLNFETKSWYMIANTVKIRDSVTAVVDQRNENIYVCGGREFQEYLNDTVEVYSISNDKWTLFSDLTIPFKTYSHGTSFINEHQILVFGGEVSSTVINAKACIIDLQKRKVEEIPQMQIGGGVVNEVLCFNKNVYTFTYYGFSERKLHCFEIETKNWKLLN